MSLRVKVFISFLIITILPLSILIILYYYDAKTHLETHELEALQTDAKKLADHIDNLLSFNMDIVKHLAHNSPIQALLLAPEDEKQELREQMNIWLDAQVLINPELYSALYVMNPEGICIASSSRDFIGKNYSFRPYFQHAIQGKPYLTDLFIGVTSSMPGIYASAPIVQQNNVIGVIILKFSADHMFRAMQSHEAGHKEVGHKTDSYIINQMGIILSHTKPERRYHSLTQLSPEEEQYIRTIKQFADRPVRSLNLPEMKQAIFKKTLAAPVTI